MFGPFYVLFLLIVSLAAVYANTYIYTSLINFLSSMLAQCQNDVSVGVLPAAVVLCHKSLKPSVQTLVGIHKRLSDTVPGDVWIGCVHHSLLCVSLLSHSALAATEYCVSALSLSDTLCAL